MEQRSNHKITVCTSCRHKGHSCRPGYMLIERLRAAISTAGDAISNDFEISGIACMAGCERPCTVAYHASEKATYLFGDIDPQENIDDLVDFAKQYADLDDGWCSATSRPPALSDKTLARVPAAVIATRADNRPLQ